MAYFRDFGKCVTDRCGKLAVCEVFNSVNATHGKFCARCAGILVARLNREEHRELNQGIKS